MYAVATFLIVAVITLVFTQFATGALIATGVPPEVAAFQARSAFSGAGFTTTETENVVNHRIRRKIIAATMFVGSLGTPTLVVTVLAGLIAPGPGSTTERTLVIVSGFILVLVVISSRPIRGFLVNVGRNATWRRLEPALDEAPQELLVLGEDYTVSTILVANDPGETSRSLRGLESAIPGVTILGVRQGRRFVGERPADLRLSKGDELVVYARRERLEALHDDVGPDTTDA